MARDANNIPSVEFLKECMDYDPQTGVLTWRFRPVEHFVDDRIFRSWNTRRAGTVAFNSPDPVAGYLRGHLGGKSYAASRIIWKMMTGEDADTIDHINGDRVDNRIANLRNDTSQQNSRNMKLFSNNKSGCPGVRLCNRRGHWTATIKVDYHEIYLGSFATREEAIAARLAAERVHRFDPSHGKR